MTTTPDHSPATDGPRNRADRTSESRGRSNPVLLLGGAQSDFARTWAKKSDNLATLLRETLASAFEDAQLDETELRALSASGRLGGFLGNFNAPCFLGQGHLGAFLTEAHPAFVGAPAFRYEAACASGSIALEAADAKIRAGELDLAIVAGVEIMRTVNPAKANEYLGLAAPRDEVAELPFAFPRIFGCLTDLIIEREEGRRGSPVADRIEAALSAISANNYANATRNPFAHMRDFPTGEPGEAKLQALDKRFAEALGGRTRYRDCSQVSDGSAVVILASPAFAEDYRRRRDRKTAELAAITGRGRRTAPMRLNERVAEFRNTPLDRHPLPWTRQAIGEAFARAGRDARSLQVFETHDCFTSSELLALSAFGLCAPGDECAFVEDGGIGLESTSSAAASAGAARGVPVNPGGGLIGGGHPVGATGVRMALDLLRQTTGRAGDVQVPGARAGAMLNIGGSFATNACFVIENAEKLT